MYSNHVDIVSNEIVNKKGSVCWFGTGKRFSCIGIRIKVDKIVRNNYNNSTKQEQRG